MLNDLLSACKNGNIELVKELFDILFNSDDLSFINMRDVNPLFEKAINQNEIIMWLYEKTSFIHKYDETTILFCVLRNNYYVANWIWSKCNYNIDNVLLALKYMIDIQHCDYDRLENVLTLINWIGNIVYDKLGGDLLTWSLKNKHNEFSKSLIKDHYVIIRKDHILTACRYSTVEFLLWLTNESKIKVDCEYFKSAAYHNNIEVCKWFMNNYTIDELPYDDATYYSVNNGLKELSLMLISFIIENKIIVHSIASIFYSLLKFNNLEISKRFYNHFEPNMGSQFNELLSYVNDLETCKWIIDICGTNLEEAFDYAIKNENIEIAEWIYSISVNKPILTEDNLRSLIMYGSIENLKWIESKGMLREIPLHVLINLFLSGDKEVCKWVLSLNRKYNYNKLLSSCIIHNDLRHLHLFSEIRDVEIKYLYDPPHYVYQFKSKKYDDYKYLRYLMRRNNWKINEEMEVLRKTDMIIEYDKKRYIEFLMCLDRRMEMFDMNVYIYELRGYVMY